MFFYTIYYPYQWQGKLPEMHTVNPDTNGAITSLEEAKSVAERFKKESYDWQHCITTYGSYQAA